MQLLIQIFYRSCSPLFARKKPQAMPAVIYLTDKRLSSMRKESSLLSEKMSRNIPIQWRI